MSGSLVKMLYILHWLLIDAANECNEEDDHPQSGGASQVFKEIILYIFSLKYYRILIQRFRIFDA